MPHGLTKIKTLHHREHIWYARLFCLIVLLIGVLVLAGWQFHIDFIKYPIPGLVAMNPTTALGFIAISGSFLLLAASKTNQLAHRAGYVLAGMALLIALLRLEDFLLTPELNIDMILFSGKLAEDSPSNLSSRMAPNTAASFLLSAVSLFFIHTRKWRIEAAQSIAFLIVVISLFSILGYLYEVKEFYGILEYLPMAVHTAVCFLLFAVSLLFFSSDRGLMKIITSPLAGGVLGRILIPFAILIPFGLGFLKLYAFWNFGFSVEFGAAALVLSIILVFVSLTWIVANSLNEKDQLRRDAQLQVQLAYTILQSSIESLKDVLIFSIDTHFKYLNFNQSFKEATRQVYGTEVQIGNSMLTSITRIEDREKAKANCEEALQGRNHSTIEIFGDLDRQYFETRYNPIHNQQGEVIGVTVLSENVTERKLFEEKIMTLNKDLEAFSYSVAHDLQAPLRLIDGYSSILIEDYSKKLDEEFQRLLKVISRNAQKMGQLIEDLLRFSKLGKSTVNKSHVNMKQVIKEVVTEQSELVDPGRLDIRLGTLEDLVCDEVLMRLVFSNLLSNAIKYSGKREKSIIEINSMRSADKVTYSVKDNGTGFDMKNTEQMFQVFQRFHKPTDFDGTGVGLAIVDRIIQKHGGKIWAEGEEDKGATFYFSLPAGKN